MRKRGPYQQYTVKEQAEIGKYACNHGASTAAHAFSLKLGVRLNESRARSMKQAYVEGCRQKQRTNDVCTLKKFCKQFHFVKLFYAGIFHAKYV